MSEEQEKGQIEDEILEHQLCKVEDLQINEKKLIRIDNVGVVVYRKSENEFVAFGNKCSHYAAPMINGVIYKDLAICPWHGACFNINTGDIEDYPGCDNIPSFKTFIKDGEVFLTTLKSKFQPKVHQTLQLLQLSSQTTFLIIGGGPAGFQCADTLRREGFGGGIVMVTSEDALPYDRTKLSKNLACNIDNILLRNQTYYEETKIEVKLNLTCNRLDTVAQMAYLDDDSELRYDKLFIATGSTPRKYDALLDTLQNVFYLRSHRDAKQIHDSVEGKNVVLIGSSFIVIEIACSIHKLAKSISIISRTEVPFAKSLGMKIGESVKQLLISKDIKFYVAPDKLNFIVDQESVLEVVNDSFNLPVDVCVIGIGSLPNTNFLKNSDVKLNKQAFVEVDHQFKTSVDNVYAGGDVVVYPHPILKGKMKNVSHWQTAQAHGRMAALAMLNKTPKFKSIPFFWSAIFGKGIRFSGTIEDPDNCLIDGDLAELAFAAYYFDSEDQVIGVATMGRDPMASAFAALLRDEKILTKQDIELESDAWFENNFH